MSTLGRRTPMTIRLTRRRQITEGGCWEWLGNRNPYGYGRILVSDPIRRMRFVHRVSYETFVGPIPDGLVIDHLCRNHSCFNPSHLEPVTDAENRSRGMASPTKTRCLNGHEFTPENTRAYVASDGSQRRVCRACVRENSRRYQARRAQVRAS